MTYVFGELRLDPLREEVSRDGERVELGPIAMAILRYPIENRDRVIKKQELLNSIWQGVFVSESALHSRISELRTAFGQKCSESI